MLWYNTQQQHDKIIKKLTEISHRKKCMTDLSSCSTPNETLHKVTIDIYEAVEAAFGIYMFSLCTGISLYLPVI